MFEKGRVYRRAELHHEWAGTTRLQQQGGILTPRGQSLIVAITGDAGEEFGYADHWDGDGVFHYYGAGQRGDMQFARGNLALRDHAEKARTSICSRKPTVGFATATRWSSSATTNWTASPTRTGLRAERSFFS